MVVCPQWVVRYSTQFILMFNANCKRHGELDIVRERKRRRVGREECLLEHSRTYLICGRVFYIVAGCLGLLCHPSAVFPNIELATAGQSTDGILMYLTRLIRAGGRWWSFGDGPPHFGPLHVTFHHNLTSCTLSAVVVRSKQPH